MAGADFLYPLFTVLVEGGFPKPENNPLTLKIQCQAGYIKSSGLPATVSTPAAPRGCHEIGNQIHSSWDGERPGSSLSTALGDKTLAECCNSRSHRFPSCRVR